MTKLLLSLSALLSSALLLAACASAPAPERVVTSGTEATIESGGWQGMLWLSQNFDGTQRRAMEGNRLRVEMEQRAASGGLDAGVGLYTGSPKPRFGDLHPEARACFTYDVDLAGEGRWWAGPKISVNWRASGDPDGTAGWYENYVVETASTSPASIAEGLLDWGEGTFVGETVHDGGTYRHYRARHRDWVQYWAIRQEWRDSGTTSLEPIFALWEADGLSGELPFDGVKLNLETYGPVAGAFEIEGEVARDYRDAESGLCAGY